MRDKICKKGRYLAKKPNDKFGLVELCSAEIFFGQNSHLIAENNLVKVTSSKEFQPVVNHN